MQLISPALIAACRSSIVASSRRNAILGGQREPLPRQQLPGAVLLLPDLEDTDPRGRRLSVLLGLGKVDVASYGGVAGHGHLELGERERLDDRLPCKHP